MLRDTFSLFDATTTIRIQKGFQEVQYANIYTMRKVHI